MLGVSGRVSEAGAVRRLVGPPGFNDLVGVRTQRDMNGRIEFVADGHHELTMLGLEQFEVAAEDKKRAAAVLSRAFAMDLKQRIAVLAQAGCGAGELSDRLQQSQAIPVDPISLVHSKEHSYAGCRGISSAKRTSG